MRRYRIIMYHLCATLKQNEQVLSQLINVSVSPKEEQPKDVFRLDQATVHRGDSGVLQLKFTQKQVVKTQGSD